MHPTMGYTIDHSGTLAAGTSQALISGWTSSSRRRFFFFQNAGANVMYLAFGLSPTDVPTAVAGQPSILVAAGTSLQFDHAVPQGNVAVIGTAGQAFTCKTMD